MTSTGRPTTKTKPTRKAEPLLRTISDTAVWMAVYRALETERRDPLFRDPFARELAGRRGEEIARSKLCSKGATWAWIVRTYLFDELITEQVKAGVNTVVNLAAGLDTRPYRLALPSSLKWIEVDLPEVLEYKEQILSHRKPACALERFRLDLSSRPARRKFFSDLG